MRQTRRRDNGLVHGLGEAIKSQRAGSISSPGPQVHKSELMNLQLLIDSTPALIHSGLPDGYLDFFNQCWLNYVGLSLENLLGWKWMATIHPEDVGAFVEKWRAAVATGEPFEAETRIRRADGKYCWMVHRGVPLRDGVEGERDGKDS